MKTSAFATVAIAALVAGASTTGAQNSRPSTIAAPANRSAAAADEPAKSGRIPINGIHYYYEIHGSGEPLLLLHGGLLSIDLMRPIIPVLAEHRQVIAVDLQGHGRTDLGPRPISLIDGGNDLSALLEKLGHRQVDVLGYSFGGGAGLRLAIQHPTQVRRLVIVSAPYAQDGFFPEMLPQQAAVSGAIAETLKETPMYKSYASVAPRPQDFPRLLDRMGEYMRAPYDWSADVKTLKMPVMLIYGDSDMVRPEHIVSFYQLLGGGLKDAGWQREHMARNRLAILPNLTHYETGLAPEMVRTALTFLDGESSTAHAHEEEQAGRRDTPSEGDTMKTKTTSEVIAQFNQAFVQHDASLLTDLVAEDCVMETVEPAPDGTRYVGRKANLAFWENLANNRDGAFAPEEVVAFGDRATIRWRFRFGPELAQSVRGVTLVRVRDGMIVEALAYSKSGDTAVAAAVRGAGAS